MKSQVLLNTRFAFRLYQKRADYKEATGKDAPDYDPTRRIKRWEDPAAADEGLPEVIYQNVLMTKKNSTDWVLRNGVPVTTVLALPVDEAMTVNLPPEDSSGNTSIQDPREVPCPFLPLGPDEVLAVAGAEMGFLSGTQIVIRNTKLFAEEMAKQADESGKFTSADRAMLKAIAAKLGV